MKHSIIKNFAGWNSLTESSSPIQEADAAAPAATPITAEDGALKNTDLMAVQDVLIKAGTLSPTNKNGKTSADGLMGPDTIAAIKAFREKNKITGDSSPGVNKQGFAYIGSKTLDQINKSIAGPTEQPAAGQPATGQPATGQPATGQPAAGQPAAGQPAAGQPAAGQPAAGQPAAGQPAAGQPAAEQPAAAKPETVGAKQIVDAISAKFQEAEFWKPFKGKGGIFGNDDEKNAIAAFSTWYDQTIQPMIDKMAADDKNKAVFGNLKASLTSGIERKLNKVPVSYTAPDGTAATVNINADF